MKILNVDSQIINNIQSCARKAQLANVYNLQPFEREEALEKGDLMHKMLEVYYSLKLDYEPNRTKGTWKELVEEAKIYPLGDPVQRAIEAGTYFASKMEIEVPVIEEVMQQFEAYCEYYRHDQWHPLHVEKVGTEIIYQEPDLIVAYNFKVDLVAEKGNITDVPWDHKTGKRRQEPSSLSNQFIGYCYCCKSDNIVINKIGFQKSLTPAERFNRYVLTIDKARLEEWRKNTIYWTIQYDQMQADNFYPMNLTSCDKYAGCIFRKVCETDPENRDWKIRKDFQEVPKWDVARSLEVSET